MSDLLKVQDLHMWIQTDKGLNHILRGVQLDIQPGEIHGLIGESGCGKTMMTKATLNLIDPKRTVIRGHIEFEGQNLSELPAKERRKIGGSRIGYITQDPLTALNPLYTVGEQIAEMLRYHKGMKKKEAAEEAARQLERVGIKPGAEMAKRYPHQFSGGQLQRICIAMAVCCEPKLLFADEPTTALDVTTQAQILDLLKSLQKNGLAILLITHDFGVVSEICERVSVMEKGVIVEEGSTDEIFQNPQKAYTKRLIDSAVRKEGAYE